jgi:hypothetical protein
MSASRMRDVVVIAVSITACSSSVQDLGRNVPDEAKDEIKEDPTHNGFGAEWACPDSPLQRDLACPLTMPIEGDACGSRNSAPCAYSDSVTTFCICTRDLRWSCVHGITMRTLDAPFADGDLCEGPLSFEVPGSRCTCENGRARCTP